MKKLTNYAAGARGLTLKPKDKDGAHEIVWIEPGESVSVDAARIVEPLPDLGTKPANDETADQVEALTARNTELEKLVGEQSAQIEKLTADLDKATKPAK